MSWIVTVQQKKFRFDAPEEFDYDIHAIAHALSCINRYTGHCAQPYSVAQHCTLIAKYIYHATGSAMKAYQGLFHDGAEFVIGDISSPLKAYLREHTNALKELEDKVQAVIDYRFNVDVPYDPIVKECDMRISLNEKEKFFPNVTDKWQIEQQGLTPLQGVKIDPVPHFIARLEFLDMFFFLRERLGYGNERHHS